MSLAADHDTTNSPGSARGVPGLNAAIDGTNGEGKKRRRRTTESAAERKVFAWMTKRPRLGKETPRSVIPDSEDTFGILGDLDD